jgi:hypothetical protein
VVHADTTGRVQDARLRVVIEAPPEGLFRLDLAFEERADLGGYRREPVVVAVAREGSPAAAALAAALAVEPRDAAGRIAWVIPVRGGVEVTLAPVLAALRTALVPAAEAPPARAA